MSLYCVGDMAKNEGGLQEFGGCERDIERIRSKSAVFYGERNQLEYTY